jgi:hypothetical protein
MTPESLKENLLTELKKEGVVKIHPLHDLMIDECCESALNLPGTDEIHLLSVKIGFVTANATLIGILKASLTQADTVTLNYRGQTFIIDNNSPILQPI